MPDEPLELALRALGRKERSTAELTRWLAERGVSEEDVGATVDHLVEVGELDDARFARRYAEDKRALAGWGAERIRESLIARGVEPEDIEAAMAADEEPDQVVRAAALLARRASPVDSDRPRASARLSDAEGLHVRGRPRGDPGIRARVGGRLSPLAHVPGQSSLAGRPKRSSTSVANRSRAGPRLCGVTNEVTSVARGPSRVSTSSDSAV